MNPLYHWIGTICLWSLIFSGCLLFVTCPGDIAKYHFETPLAVLLILNVINIFILMFKLESGKQNE